MTDNGFTEEQILKAGDLGEISLIDVKHLIVILKENFEPDHSGAPDNMVKTFIDKWKFQQGVGYGRARFNRGEELANELNGLLVASFDSGFANGVESERSKWKNEMVEEEIELCDVKKCKLPASSGGAGWRESGYWRLCHDHWDDAHKGKPQPQMKQEAINRENSRDKTTRCLPHKDK